MWLNDDKDGALIVFSKHENMNNAQSNPPKISGKYCLVHRISKNNYIQYEDIEVC